MVDDRAETVRAASTRRHPAKTTLWVLLLLTLATGCADLAAREIARRPLFPAIDAATVTLAVVIGALAGIAVLLGRGLRQPSPRTANRALALALVASFAIGLSAQLRLGARLQSDGFYYFAYLRSLWFDRDVDFTNDYKLLGFGDKPHLFQPTPTGYAQSAWTIGPAIVWTPFFAVGHLTARGLRAAGAAVSTDGTSFPYRQAVCVAGLFYGLVGLMLCYGLCSLFFTRGLAAAATALMATGSFLLWYLVKEPSMTHAPSMAAVAAFTYAWARTRERRGFMGWVLLGLGAGLMTTIRWQNALFALLPAIEGLFLLADAWRSRDRALATRVVVGGLGFAAAAVVGFMPQMLAWRAIYGQFLAVSPLGPEIRWSEPHLVDILWSSRNGLFSVSPVLYAAAAGLVGFVKRERRFAVAALGAVLAMIYFNACIQDWWGSAGFGMRRFDGVLPLLAVGLGASAQWLIGTVRRHPALVAAVLLGALVLWNVTFMAAAVSGAARIGEAVSFGELASHQVRFAHRWFGYPFSYPINLLFALRNGVSPARYDLLGVNRMLSDPLRPYGRIDVGLDDEAMLGDGWHAAERDGDTTFRWTGTIASLLVSLDRAADLVVRLRLTPFSPPGSPPQQIWIRINSERHGPFTLGPGWQDVNFTAARREWRAGLNRLTIECSRVLRPIDVGAGDDSRPLGVALDFLRVQEQ